MFRTTMLTAATTAIAAAFLLTACGTPEPTTRPAPAAAAPAAAAEPDLAEHTRQVFDITWGTQTEAQRDTLCTSLTILGPEQSATEMAGGAADSQDIDWTLMVDLLATECDNR